MFYICSNLQEDGAVHAPLVVACKHGSLEVIKLLLEHHADVHKRCKVYIRGGSCTHLKLSQCTYDIEWDDSNAYCL